MQLNLSNIEYTYPSSVEPTLHDVTITLPQGWTGFVGNNGSGKQPSHVSYVVYCNLTGEL